MRPIVALALLSSLVPACQQADAQGPADGDDALTAKMNLYVHCVNDVSKLVLQGRELYLAQEKEGPHALIPALAERCLSGLEKAPGMRPPLAGIETAGARYREALLEVRPLVDEAHAARSRDPAKHEALLAAWSRFAAADQALRRELDAVQKEIDARDLARLEKGGGLEFHSKRVVARAEAMVRLVAESAAPPDARTLGTVAGEYLAAEEALEQHLAAHPETDGLVMGPHSAFSASARSMAAQAREIAAGRANVDDAVEEYNRMINYWNMLTWKR